MIMKYWKAKTDFNIPHNKHLGRKSKDWQVPNIVKKNMESLIKWQTGEPKEEGRYLVTTIDGHIATAVMIKDDLHDKYFFNQYVKAWCKLSDIEPYKEE